MNIIAIIQARMGSSRLPGKVLKPLGNTYVLDYVVARAKRIKGVGKVVVATTTHEKDLPIVKWCKDNNLDYFQGSELDVLERFYKCSRLYKADYIIRITSDCPFLDYEMASDIVNVMKKNPSDYIKINNKEDLPRGLAVEMFSKEAIAYIDEHGREPHHREHVTYYGYEYPSQFNVMEYMAPKSLCYPSLRITLDTPEDYALCLEISAQMRDKLASSQKVVKFLLENPEIAEINRDINQKSVK